ncbi:hypothetical protein QBC46DRAFT_459002 [Diplogelasinospora grovesii]|uniref:Lytic polysaccharide monooxygenase n=1 Tax=Diplogelasinospora grovesii TaxID=303347 RepID=A0AAN6N7A7_9PEZI|nr:hypothetical protein QBC46DRAFT_459002 [Diplogelasinospora grovesii]
MVSKKSLAAACTAFAVAKGHMFMATPVRFASPKATNGPLLADGSNFPCQAGAAGGSYSASTVNTMALGSQQPLSFIGQAVHGGGSCQISITYDTAPSKSSKWKVIKSIEGGCPAKGQAGNMGDSADAPDPDVYSFTIPDDIPAGNATVAWTWFNKVGNREMYMQCAPVALTGSSKGDNYDSLPDMFTANIGNGCATRPDTDLLFPNPGKAVEQLNGATSAFAAPTGTCQQQAAGGGAAPPAQPTGGAGGGFQTGGASAGAPAATTSAATAAQPTAAPAAGGGAGGGASGSGLTGACSPEGTFNCVSGGKSFQQCASGQWSVVQPLASGTSCTGGQSATLNVVRSKRAVAFQA